MRPEFRSLELIQPVQQSTSVMPVTHSERRREAETGESHNK